MRHVLFAALMSAALSAAMPAGAADKSPAQSFDLANGMKVVVIEDHRAPVVTHMVWYRVGAADEPAGFSGVAHFLEHLMFKGTEKNPAGAFSKKVAAIGGQENAFTSQDYTAYYQRAARENLPMLMAFEADRMRGLILTDEVVKPERDVVLEERRSRTDNEPSARLYEELSAALFRNHPFRKPIIGWRHEIEQLSRDNALAFYKRFYTPENAILVVAGDVKRDEVKSLAEASYGKLPRRAEPVRARARPAEPDPVAARTVTLADARVAQASMQRQWVVPAYGTAKTGEAEALEVLAYILGTGTNSRLYKALVIEQPLAATASAWYQGDQYEVARFGVAVTPRPDVEMAKLEGAMEAVIAAIAEKGPEAGEVERARNRLIADTIYARDSQFALARQYGVALTTGRTIDDVDSWPDRIGAVTAAEVQAAAKAYLDRARSVTGYLLRATSPEKRS